ncbi:hypothetical protein F441_11210 [Phytophthora nicotianae CJ01A1]|uniref:Uncharacterized protein n=5 Tax=Phytophthora nicotianae TaxID=4792 RepID=W2Q2W2_PHYN3|nr:hypothetical protein PPTG_23203 [Phytophthora nicotianae INRA-310]ETI43918.1 hypothetical protein F443_11289 [Phytophthora nicotianae P1569]ETL37383.1 hypothetical protein L916_10901 [Phytophthora nicotianae]ETP13738.1 hypothetical protein F441_11210 [Phytophthora nicotianae CJ01A1]ETP27494.1 hypothetical protein F442_23230 [Phytophthora nicotianae P10297]ETM43844.1 hypothetical protein L914_10841 [Phytophthora nicotianae]
MSASKVLRPKSASLSRVSLLTVEQSSAVYAIAWVFIVLFHVACGAYLICAAMTYWYLTKGSMSFYVSTWSLTGNENYRLYGAVYVIVGGIYALQVLNILIMSIGA